jgi:hypothetical protein
MNKQKPRELKEIELEQFQLELMLCYCSQNNIPSFVDYLLPRNERFLCNLALSLFLQQRLDSMNEGHFLSMEEFMQRSSQ